MFLGLHRTFLLGALAVMVVVLSGCGGSGSGGAMPTIPELDVSPADFAAADLSTPEAVHAVLAALPLHAQSSLLSVDPTSHDCTTRGRRTPSTGQGTLMTSPYAAELPEALDHFSRWFFSDCHADDLWVALSGVVTQYCGASDACETVSATVVGEGQTPLLRVEDFAGVVSAQYLLKGQLHRFQSGDEQRRQLVAVMAGTSRFDPVRSPRTFIGFSGDTQAPLAVDRVGDSISINGPFGVQEEEPNTCSVGAAFVETLTPLVETPGVLPGASGQYTQGRLRISNSLGASAIVQLGADGNEAAVIEIDGETTTISPAELRLAQPYCWR